MALMPEMYELLIVVLAEFSAMARFCPAAGSPCT
jgi:hypothetical protein